MEFNPNEIAKRDVYKLMTASVVPRPIAWVSTKTKEGGLNLAPFSYFNAVSSNPPTIVFSIGTRDNGRFKDTYYNIIAHKEFVVNFVNEATVEAMNITAGNYPPDVNEFERANLTPIDSKVIGIPRVAESPIHFECTLNQAILIGDETSGNYLIIGTIVYIHVDDAIYMGNHKIDIEKYQPVGRLMGTGYSRVNDLFDLNRPPSEI